MKVTLRVADAGFAAQLQREVRHLDGGPALAVSPPSVPFSEFIAGQQMLIVSYNSWLHITRSRSALIPSFPSFMVVKPARAQVPDKSRTIIRTVRPAQADAVTFDGSVQSVSADPGIRAAADVTATGSARGSIPSPGLFGRYWETVDFEPFIIGIMRQTYRIFCLLACVPIVLASAAAVTGTELPLRTNIFRTVSR